MPPRIAQETIKFHPILEESISQLWKSVPTWMATHCKVVFRYDTPFWREQNLSGEVFSQYGPLSEIYDGSAADGQHFALTAFVRLNPRQRRQMNSEQFMAMCMAQLERLFGVASENVKGIHIKDWSLDGFTSTNHDLNGAAHHPQYPENMPRQLWNKQILLAGTEIAAEHGGYIEGALESADDVLSVLLPKN